MQDSQSVSHPSTTFAVFPGQGSQFVGMAKDLYENFPIAREIFEEASDSIHVNLKKLCFEGPESDLVLTENTQPCLLTASVAAFRVAEKELDFRPGAVAGHSLGEYSALVAIRSLGLASAVRWVKERGAAMQKAVPAGEGKMAAVMGLEDSLVELLCKKATDIANQKRAQGESNDVTVSAIAEPANFNAPGQVVIAGSRDAIDEAIALLKAGGEFAGGKVIPLQVSAPFHCRLMRPARDRMAELFSQASAAQMPQLSQCPYVPNRTGRLTHEAGVVFELLVEQVDHPVLWKQSVQNLLDGSFHTAVEFGPGKVLCGLIKRIASQAGKNCSLASVGDSATLKALEASLKTSK
jgi:[acyl-carrier-protein] S-malonyltransferase